MRSRTRLAGAALAVLGLAVSFAPHVTALVLISLGGGLLISTPQGRALWRARVSYVGQRMARWHAGRGGA